MRSCSASPGTPDSRVAEIDRFSYPKTTLGTAAAMARSTVVPPHRRVCRRGEASARSWEKPDLVVRTSSRLGSTIPTLNSNSSLPSSHRLPERTGESARYPVWATLECLQTPWPRSRTIDSHLLVQILVLPCPLSCDLLLIRMGVPASRRPTPSQRVHLQHQYRTSPAHPQFRRPTRLFPLTMAQQL